MNWSRMNKALIQRFLSLILEEHYNFYTSTLMNNPYGTFNECFNYYHREYGTRNELEFEESHNGMRKPCNPIEGFKVL